MSGIFTYIWLIFMVNVGKYTIHGSYGLDSHDFFWTQSSRLDAGRQVGEGSMINPVTWMKGETTERLL